MLLKLGRRSGVGPVMLDNGSSQPAAHKAKAAAAMARMDTRMTDLRGGRGAGRDDHQRATHVVVLVATVLGAQNREASGLFGREVDDHRFAATRDQLLDLHLLDLETMNAVGGSHNQTHRLANGDLNLRGLEDETACGD